MPQVNTMYVTLTCDQCQKTVTYLNSNEQAELSKEENSWVIKTARRILNLVPAQGQQKPVDHLYCSDVCTIEASKSGVLNVPEPKRIIEGAANAAQVAEAAAAAKAAVEASKQLKAGQPVTL
jgi:hypothetical protein